MKAKNSRTTKKRSDSISRHKRLFEKGATANYSKEIFQISDVLVTKRPIVRKIKDLAGEEVDGTFYRQQLQKTNQDIYRVDRIIQRRRAANNDQEVLVKWAGYPNKLNSWLPAADIIKSGIALNE